MTIARKTDLVEALAQYGLRRPTLDRLGEKPRHDGDRRERHEHGKDTADPVHEAGQSNPECEEEQKDACNHIIHRH